MAASPVAHLEARAAEAEQRLDAIEAKLAASGGGGSPLPRHLHTLQDIKKTLLAAKQEHIELAVENKALQIQNSKLKYQVEILKQSVREGDEKLLAATTVK